MRRRARLHSNTSIEAVNIPPISPASGMKMNDISGGGTLAQPQIAKMPAKTPKERTTSTGRRASLLAIPQ